MQNSSNQKSTNGRSATVTSNSNSVTNNSPLTSEQQIMTLEKELEILNKQLAISGAGTTTLASAAANSIKKPNLTKNENELQLLEQRIIIYLKLKSWNELIEEGYRILGKKGPSVIVYKSVLVGLCRVGRFDDDVRELLNHWKKAAPKDLDMLDTSKKMMAYQIAIRSGVNPNDLFKNLEEALGLNADWVTNRKITPSQFNWKFRPPPKMQTTFYLCPRTADSTPGFNSCIYGADCISAHSKEELEEWKRRQEIKSSNKNSNNESTTPLSDVSGSYYIGSSKPNEQTTVPYSCQPNLAYSRLYPTHALNYLKDIKKRMQETKDIRTLLADQLVDVNFVCNTSMKVTKTIPATIGNNLAIFLATKWTFLVGSRQPVRTVCLIHEAHREYFSISSAFFINSAGKNLNLIEIHENNKVQRGRLQVLNTFVPQNMIQLLGGWPEWFYYKIELSFIPPPIALQLHSQIYGSFRQSIMFDFKSDPKLVKHVLVEVLPAQASVGALNPQFKNPSFNSAHTDEVEALKSKVSLPVKSPGLVSNDAQQNHQVSPVIVNTGAVGQTVTHPKAFDVSPKTNSEPSSTVIRLWNTDLFDLVDSEAGLSVGPSKRYHSDGFNSGDSSESEHSLDLGSNDDEFALSRGNYLQVMARLISVEAKTYQDRLSKLNLTTSLELTSNYCIERNSESFLKCSYCGQLYGRLELDSKVVEDSSLGHFILRNCSSVYLAPLDKFFGSRTKPRVYICKIADKLKSSIIIVIGPRAVSELNLKSGSSMMFHIQFQLDSLHFRTMKSVLEGIGDIQLDLLFPKFGDKAEWVTFPKDAIGLFYEGDLSLNMKQMEAYNAITYRSGWDGKPSKIPPVLIIGPFGTGKTHTLAQSLKKLLLAPAYAGKYNRILICTHSNSGADIYITNFIHPWLKDEKLQIETAKPLRIYFADGLVQSVSTVVKHYCLFTNDGHNFRYPTKEEVLNHRVIIVTLSTVMELIQLGLDEDTFTHIFIDEAAQCLETETIPPLILAGQKTRVVLAGDHMQLSPEMLGTLDMIKPMSLIERLNAYYPTDHSCRVVLMENYRSHNAILKYAGARFYQSQLRCASIQPTHSVFFPLTFFSVTNGEEFKSEDGTSYYNMAEVKEIVLRIGNLLRTWSPQWESPTDCSNAIVVLTPYPEQVLRIRNELKINGFPFINVDRVLNVQGKQFRVVFISTVRTFGTSDEKYLADRKEEIDLGFFNNAKMLNTAVTRAQSLVSVVGDPISLCFVGKCSKLWQDYLQTTWENKSCFGITETDLLQIRLRIQKVTVPSHMQTTYTPKLETNVFHGLNFDIPTSTKSETPMKVSNDNEFQASRSIFPDSSKAVGSKLTKSISEGDDDFLDKILNTATSLPSPPSSNDKSFSNLASIWERKNDSEINVNTNGWSRSSGSTAQTANKSPFDFSSFANYTPVSISSSIWSTNQDEAISSITSPRLMAETQNLQHAPVEEKISNNLDYNSNFGSTKKIYYDQSNKSSFDEDDDSKNNISCIDPPLKTFHNTIFEDKPIDRFSENENVKLHYDEQPTLFALKTTGFPVAVGSEQKRKPSPAAASMLQQIKSALSSNSSSEKESTTPEFKSLNNALPPRENPTELFATSEIYNPPTTHLPRKPFTYEVPPRMMKHTAEAAVPYDTSIYGRNVQQKFGSSFNTKDMNALLFHHNVSACTNNNIAALGPQQMMDIKAIVGPHAGMTPPTEENSSSASSTASSTALDSSSKSVDRTEFPSLYEVENRRPKGSSSEWVEVKKSKKAPKAQQNAPDGPDTPMTVEKKIEALQQMGFDKKKAIRALQNCDKDLERAVEYLLAGSISGASAPLTNTATGILHNKN